ncbi:MAG: carbohydrate ABC transporter permease, partial [Bacteroidota bacterium]
KLFWKALGNTFFFTMGTVPLTTALAIFFAVLINSRLIKRKDFFRSTFFIPSVTSLIVVALIFSNLYARDGYINAIMSMLNLPYPESGWLLNPDTALLSVMAMDVWMATGYYMILFLSGMQTIPEDLYESAKLSGANAWQQFRRITLPLLKPTLLFVVIINTIKSFQVFIEIFVMTKGGPLNSTMTLVYMVYVNAFEKTDMMGYASALAYIVFILLLILSFIQAKLLKFDRN